MPGLRTRSLPVELKSQPPVTTMSRSCAGSAVATSERIRVATRSFTNDHLGLRHCFENTSTRSSCRTKVMCPLRTSSEIRDGASGRRRNRVHVGDLVEDLVVGDLRGAIVVDLGRESFRGVVIRANQSRRTIDRGLNEREEIVNRLSETRINTFSRLKVEHTSDFVIHDNDEQRVSVPAETTALQQEC